MHKRLFLALPCALFVLLACDFFQPPPTLTPTYALSAPTLPPTVVVRGEVPTLPPQNIGQNDPTAAAVQSGGALPPLMVGTVTPGQVKQPIQITSAHGALLTGDLYSAGTERVPGILMLAPDSSAWLDLPLRLNAAGFTVLAMNLTDVGGSADFTVMLRSLADAGATDPGSLGVIGAEAGADLALAGCAIEPLCDVAVLISPLDGATDPAAMRAFSGHPVMIVAGADDGISAPLAAMLNAEARGPKAFEQPPGNARGAALIRQNPAVGDRMIEWLKAQFAG